MFTHLQQRSPTQTQRAHSEDSTALDEDLHCLALLWARRTALHRTRICTVLRRNLPDPDVFYTLAARAQKVVMGLGYLLPGSSGKAARQVQETGTTHSACACC